MEETYYVRCVYLICLIASVLYCAYASAVISSVGICLTGVFLIIFIGIQGLTVSCGVRMSSLPHVRPAKALLAAMNARKIQVIIPRRQAFVVVLHNAVSWTSRSSGGNDVEWCVCLRSVAIPFLSRRVDDPTLEHLPDGRIVCRPRASVGSEMRIENARFE